MSTNDGVESAFTKLGIDLCGLSLDWLLVNKTTSRPLLWLQDSLGSENILTPQLAQQFADLKEDEILTDSELDIEFEKLFLDTKYDFTFSDDACDEIEENIKLDDIRRKIDLATEQLDSLNVCANGGLEMNSKFNKDLEYHKRIRCEKLFELSEITKQCQDTTAALEDQKSHLNNLVKDETKNFISLGKDYRLQLNEEQFHEYFSSCDSITAFFHNHINNNLQKPSRTLDGSIDEDDESIDPQLLIASRNKMEVAIHNYMKAKSELNEAEEILKFHLRYDENDSASLSSLSRELHKKLRRLDFIDKGTEHAISCFVKNQIANIIYGDIKLKTINIEYLFKELTIVESHVKSLVTCGELLSSSLINQEKRKDEVIVFLYTVVQSLLSDINVVEKRQKIVDTLKEIPSKSHLMNEFLHVKREIYKLFQFNEDMPLKIALGNIDSKFKTFDKMKDFILNNQFVRILYEYQQDKSKLVPVQKFIWDGATSYPNICNRSLELHLHECKQKNESDGVKIKKAINLYKQLLGNSASDTLSSTLKL